MAEAVAHAAAIANAIKASGVLVRVDPTEFLRIVHRAEEPLIVVAISIPALSGACPPHSRLPEYSERDRERSSSG